MWHRRATRMLKDKIKMKRQNVSANKQNLADAEISKEQLEKMTKKVSSEERRAEERKEKIDKLEMELGDLREQVVAKTQELEVAASILSSELEGKISQEDVDSAVAVARKEEKSKV